ncbi:MAG: phosphoribosyltransferase family protein [Bacteroidota bacterium]
MLLPVKYAKRLLTDFIYTLYPRNCLNCSQILVANEEFLCTTCTIDLPKTNYHLPGPNPLWDNFAHTPLVTDAFAYLHFVPGGVAQNILHALKYHGRPEIGMYFGRRYAEELQADIDLDIDLIVPVPMHRKKQQLRGYNQSEQLALGISEVLDIPVMPDAIVKSVNTASQTKKDRLQRWENVQHAFHILKPTALYEKKILLVDDVVTTGATISALSDQLLKCDVTSITICALATGVK